MLLFFFFVFKTVMPAETIFDVHSPSEKSLMKLWQGLQLQPRAAVENLVDLSVYNFHETLIIQKDQSYLEAVRALNFSIFHMTIQRQSPCELKLSAQLYYVQGRQHEEVIAAADFSYEFLQGQQSLYGGTGKPPRTSQKRLKERRTPGASLAKGVT